MSGASSIQADGSVIPYMSSAPVEGVVALAIGQMANPGRAFVVNCSVAGNVTVIFYDGSQSTYPVVIGLNVFPFAVSELVSSTATASYENWK